MAVSRIGDQSPRHGGHIEVLPEESAIKMIALGNSPSAFFVRPRCALRLSFRSAACTRLDSKSHQFNHDRDGVGADRGRLSCQCRAGSLSHGRLALVQLYNAPGGGWQCTEALKGITSEELHLRMDLLERVHANLLALEAEPVPAWRQCLALRA
jgi:hypothetical protein